MIPQGHTAVDVRLASSIDELDVGDEVTLPAPCLRKEMPAMMAERCASLRHGRW